MKKIVAPLLCLLLAGAAAYWFFRPQITDVDQARERLAAAAQESILTQAENGDVSTLAVKSIDLRQGEDGVQLWRLLAEWGRLRQEDGLMILEKPRFSYRMESGEFLTVVSATGDINQDEQVVRFVGAVEARYGDNILRAPLMVYNGKERTLTLPDAAEFTNPTTEFSAPRAVWLLRERTITGEGGVRARWEGSETALAPRDESAGAGQNPATDGEAAGASP